MLPTPVLQAAYRLRFLATNNASTILSSAGIAGTVTTAVLSARSSFKAYDVIAKAETREVLGQINEIIQDDDGLRAEGTLHEPPPLITVQPLTTVEKVKLVWPLYIPPAITGITTIMAIVYAHKVDAKKIAALVAAASVSESRLLEYKDKLGEKLTKAQGTKVHDEIMQDKVDANPPDSSMVILDGKVLCMDVYTGRYFQSTREEIERSVIKFNHSVMNHYGGSLSELHDYLGLPSTPMTEIVGWNPDNIVEAVFSTAMAPGGVPCLTVDFSHPPVANYERVH